MKKLYSLVLFLAVSLCTIAQEPESFNYQAILRDVGGTTYVEIGTSQLLSAPYSLYSNRAGQLSVCLSGKFCFTRNIL